MTDVQIEAVEQEPIEFLEWPKTPRLFRNMVITEKIDGTNGAIIITKDGRVAAQSRNRLVIPGKDSDNYGFARWVYENAGELADVLGPGRHFGEWWGSGIQRGYGLTRGEKRFSLFNVERYKNLPLENVDGLGVVPVLARHTFDTEVIKQTLADLVRFGSAAAPDWDGVPEGVIVFHSQTRQVFKVLIENDHLTKTQAATIDPREELDLAA
ncbi:RNA ligase family protein [Arthrobacter sp. 18067]|uniref:RNA ligase family protein n=1 Tax=Arthrobacter sp. 18067 TaxID=2681413 RepID=UPI00135AAB6D|nr:RNA ligase family protein [Arthrobacter sp. 18067]